VRLLVSGDLDGAELFFAAGERMRPGMLFGQLARGLALQHAGRLEPALKAFLALSDGGDPLPAALLAGALQVRLGDRQAARRQFDRALEALQTAPEMDLADPYTVQAIREGARLYREENLARQADLLENNPRLRLPPKEEPPVSP
jgi:tetratricopeptide (TPR) repeat protein